MFSLFSKLQSLLFKLSQQIEIRIDGAGSGIRTPSQVEMSPAIPIFFFFQEPFYVLFSGSLRLWPTFWTHRVKLNHFRNI